MMLSFLLSLLAILVAVAAPLVTAQTTAENFISDTIAALQGSEPEILNLNALLTEGSYQSQARTAVLGILGKNIGIDKNAANEILQFYALACIYFATNGASNKFTDLVTPGCPVPTWTVDDWLLPRHYCQWTGVTCNDVQNAVVAIDLASNQLHGTFPPEVVLLKASLQRINVANNELHTSQDPKWLYRMAELQYLYFGSTSWEYPGVPQYLSGARKLIELDMSNSRWTDGPIRREAFSGLNFLEYLDMGDNHYDTSSYQQTAPSILPLISLTTLYLDRCTFTPNRPDLQFVLSGMPSLTQAYLDFTTFDGSIPVELSFITSLTTFSCAYCGLSGTIPSQLGALRNIETLRLYANNLIGTIPTQFGRLGSLSTLFLEANEQLGSPVPDALCNLDSLTSLGVECDVDCLCCTCCGPSCGNLVDPSASPTGRPTFPPLPTDQPTIPPTMPPTTTPLTGLPSFPPTMAPVLSMTPSPTEEPPRVNTGPCVVIECAQFCDALFSDFLACDTSDCECRVRPSSSPPPPPLTDAPMLPTSSPSQRICGPIQCAQFCDPNFAGIVFCDYGNCTCPGDEAPTASPTPGFVVCFSGESTVEVQNRGIVKMRDLVIGDFVKVNDDTYEPIYSFGHKKSDASATFLEILTDGRNPPLEISHDHMVVMKDNHVVPACMINVGDSLLASSGKPIAVTRIREVVRIGVYAPFTASGLITVNGVVASNYVSFHRDSHVLKIGTWRTPLSFQWLAHTFESPHRTSCYLLMDCSKESYSSIGLSRWVEGPLKFSRWLLSLHPVLMLLILVPLIMFFSVMSVIHWVAGALSCWVLIYFAGLIWMLNPKFRSSKLKSN